MKLLSVVTPPSIYQCASFLSCVFVITRRVQLITKGKTPGSIHKDADNKPGTAVSVDQIQSAQIVLVPQFLGNFSIARILAAQVMVIIVVA